MSIYFGTDGIRGEYNKILTPSLAEKVGNAKIKSVFRWRTIWAYNHKRLFKNWRWHFVCYQNM